jgi:2',3'-cyclic-nucleotide 2'-phosphodiesterase/3'-nucleotidase
VLLDNGDTIQGTALSDYQALINPIDCKSTLAIYKVMNQSGYDGGGIGNHEFNYGLPYLNQVTGSAFQVDGVTNGSTPCAGPNFRRCWPMCTAPRPRLFKPYRSSPAP